MADEPKTTSRRASDAGLEALLQEIEADARVAPARLPTNALTKIEKGQWEHARRLLEWCEERWPDDEPRKVLHAFIERDGFTAPAGWPGYRPLTEK